MKNLFAFIVFIFCFNTNYAASLVVRQDGYLSSFSTIQSAIDTSNSGDSIIVFDKYDGKPWQENLMLNKNISIVNGIDTSRLKISGRISIQPFTNMNITLFGIDLVDPINGSITNYDKRIEVLGGGISINNRGIINIIDCNFGDSYFNYDNLFINLINSSTNDVYFRHGKVIGSRTGVINIFKESSNYSISDSLILVGNISREIYIDTFEKLLICNNFIFKTIQLYYFNYFLTHINLILNNSFYGNYGASTAIIFAGPNYLTTAQILIASNIIYSPPCYYCGNSNVTLSNSGGGSLILFKYNLCYCISSSDQFTYNISPNYSPFDSFGRCSYPECIDKGNYLPEYTDIDLTRNDLGTYGGSYSIDNFQPTVTVGMGKGRVHWLDIPRVISSTSTPINIKAEGHTNH